MQQINLGHTLTDWQIETVFVVIIFHTGTKLNARGIFHF